MLCSLHIYFYYQGEFTFDINQEGGGVERENKTNSLKMLTRGEGGMGKFGYFLLDVICKTLHYNSD